jgi:molecular chaperone DnaJ
MDKRDYYEILEVDKTASQEEIKKAYRRLSKKYHPDMGGDENTFKEINEANEVLSNPEKRSKYDRHGHNGDNFNAFEEFASMFRQQQIRTGSDLAIKIDLTLEQVFNPTKKTYTYRRYKNCTECNSNGGSNLKTCTNCHGTGSVIQTTNTPFGSMQNYHVCHACSGSGNVPEIICTACNGKGIILSEDSIEVMFPAGVYTGMSTSIQGKGNGIKSGIEGSLIIHINVLPHDKFVRNANDLNYKLKLTYPQLVLGDKVEIPTIEGTLIKITIPEFSRVGDNLRVKNKGMKFINSDVRGDMIVTLDIEIPSSITKEEKKLIENLKNLSDIN